MRTQDNTNRSTNWRDIMKSVYECDRVWQEQEEGDEEEESEEYFDCD